MSTPHLRPDKSHLRKQLLFQRQQLTEQEVASKSEQIVSYIKTFLKDSPHFNQLFLYYPIQNEPDLLSLSSFGLPMALPAINKRGELEFAVWSKADPLVKDKFGFKQPQESARRVEPTPQTLVLVPGIAFDTQGYRLGYGGGHYDQYLATNREYETMGVSYQQFVVADLMPEPHDIPVKSVVSEKDLIKI